MTASKCRKRARESLGGGIFASNWLVVLVALLIQGLILSIPIVGWIFVGPFMFGISRLILITVRTNKCQIENVLSGLKEDLGGNIALYLTKSIFVFLWSLLFIIPGIIKTYSYSMAFYIKADHPEYTYSQCLNESQRMMKGNKFRLFCLQLSFIGWIFVGALCCGIGTLWVSAYMSAATAHFYEDLSKAKREEELYSEATEYKNHKKYNKATKIFKKLENFKDSNEQVALCEKLQVKKKKRNLKIAIPTVFSAVVIAVCVLIVINAIKYETVDNVKYEKSKGEYTLISCKENVSTVNIPSEINGIPVTGIGDSAFRDCDSLTSITIPDSVKSIGNYAFRNCSSLTSVKIPDSVTNIKDYAFRNCSSLTSIKIPDSVTSIGGSVFSGCDNLTNIVLSNSVTNIYHSAFYDCNNIETATIPVIAISSIPKTNLKTITITSGESIENYAFKDCDSLTSVTISDSVTSIGFSAFENCSSLTRITIGKNVTSIGSSAFSGCSSLTNIILPDNVTSIGFSAFENCSSITDIVLPDSVTSIGSSVFSGCNSLTSINIPDGITKIDYFMLSGCSSITSIIISDSVKEINSGAFRDCNNLARVYYKGNRNNWFKIGIGSSNENLNKAKRYYYSENRPIGTVNYWHYDNYGNAIAW